MTIAAHLAEMMHFKCFAHTLNLASERALKLPTVTHLLGRVRRIISFFRCSATASHVLQQKQKLLVTRTQTDDWHCYQMEQRLWHAAAIPGAAASHLCSPPLRWGEEDWEGRLYPQRVRYNICIVNAMKPMKVATLVMTEVSTPTLSVVAPLYAQLIHDLQENPMILP